MFSFVVFHAKDMNLTILSREGDGRGNGKGMEGGMERGWKGG